MFGKFPGEAADHTALSSTSLSQSGYLISFCLMIESGMNMCVSDGRMIAALSLLECKTSGCRACQGPFATVRDGLFF